MFADQSSNVPVAKDLASVLAPSRSIDFQIPGLTNPGRVLFPRDGITKRDAAAYLFQVNKWLLPHIVDRPISLLRCADGIDGEQFFQRHPGKGFPSEITTLSLDSEDEPLLAINDAEALLATAQISAIELHPWGCRSDDIENPDRIIIDLDPDEAVGWNVLVEAAFIVRSELESRDLKTFVKTTGGKGLHVVVPLTGQHTWQQVFEFSKLFATALAKLHPKRFVANMSKSRRQGKIFVDYHRNRRGATAIAAYSLRARPGASVSTPITWDELPMVNPGDFTLRTLPTRLAALRTDPWAGLESTEQRLAE
ncbi:DNA primase, small subunit [Rhodopirellula maiorica SM1]|uniref:DNA primase, small subunit n=1 Tax=Rhodopirellula maiorica SM1 TaxID=1265738 RepID=M5RPS8_9BACT|nr:DNA primase, small subunit [Rhodopirellula maiorica SM1]